MILVLALDLAPFLFSFYWHFNFQLDYGWNDPNPYLLWLFNCVAKLFFAIVFLICSIVGISIGSSLTTVATVGVAFMGIAGAMDISLTITAGAIVSGAFFGDKMSPLSDTTNLASGTVGVDLLSILKIWAGQPSCFSYLLCALCYYLPNRSCYIL